MSRQVSLLQFTFSFLCLCPEDGCLRGVGHLRTSSPDLRNTYSILHFPLGSYSCLLPFRESEKNSMTKITGGKEQNKHYFNVQPRPNWLKEPMLFVYSAIKSDFARLCSLLACASLQICGCHNLRELRSLGICFQFLCFENIFLPILVRIRTTNPVDTRVIRSFQVDTL